MIKFKDASKRLNEEWKGVRTTAYGERLREDLKEAALDMALWASTKHGVDLVVTCITATPEEDVALKRQSTTHSGANRELDAGEGCRAVDVRAKDITPELRERIAAEANEAGHTGGEMPFCVLHGEGDGVHFHFQCARGTKLQKVERRA